MKLASAGRMLRRHSALWNAVRNAGWWLDGVAVAPGARLIVDGAFEHGQRLRIGSRGRILVDRSGRLSIGDECWIAPDVEINAGTILIGDRVTVQRNSTLNGDIRIGAGCLFAPNVFVSSGRHEFRLAPWLTIRDQELLAGRGRPEATLNAAIDIGEDCWLGANSVILPGVALGRGAIVGAGAVVRQEVGPYEVAAGAPARIVGNRLQFRPPVTINAADEMQMPYLYSGFEQLRALRARSLALHGGVAAQCRFALALDVSAAHEVWIEARSSAAGTSVQVSHGSVQREVTDKWTEVRFPLVASRWRLVFTCTAPSASSVWPLAIRRAGVA